MTSGAAGAGAVAADGAGARGGAAKACPPVKTANPPIAAARSIAIVFMASRLSIPGNPVNFNRPTASPQRHRERRDKERIQTAKIPFNRDPKGSAGIRMAKGEERRAKRRRNPKSGKPGEPW
jgi:hypothetical protein